jgi:hypothetical protein
MTAPETAQTSGRPSRFQFSLRGLMVLVFGVAVGLSMGCMRTLDWTHGILGAAMAWIFLGLMAQVRDLWGTFHGRSDLAGDERWGWRFAVFWRVGVACLFAAIYILAALAELRLVDLSESKDTIWPVGAELRDALLFVCLLTVLYGVLPARQPKRSGRWSSLLEVAGVAAGVVLCVFICWDSMCVQFLVTITVQGIEMAQPLRFAREGVDLLPAARTARFFRECLLAFGLALVTLGLVYVLATQWSRARWRRVVLVALTVTAIPISAGYLIWVLAVAMPHALPVMIEAQRPVPLHVWISALLVVLVMATAATYRLVSLPVEPSRGAELSWRPAEGRYYHERPAVILLVVFAIGAQVIDVVWILQIWHLYGVLGWSEIVRGCLTEGAILLRLLVPCVAGYAWLKLIRRSVTPGMIAPRRLPAGRFCAVWMAMVLAVAIAIPAVAIFSFAVWFSPWYRLPWP